MQQNKPKIKLLKDYRTLKMITPLPKVLFRQLKMSIPLKRIMLLKLLKKRLKPISSRTRLQLEKRKLKKIKRN